MKSGSKIRAKEAAMKDATAANSAEEQNHAEAKIFPLLLQTLSVNQFL